MSCSLPVYVALVRGGGVLPGGAAGGYGGRRAQPGTVLKLSFTLASLGSSGQLLRHPERICSAETTRHRDVTNHRLGMNTPREAPPRICKSKIKSGQYLGVENVPIPPHLCKLFQCILSLCFFFFFLKRSHK